MPGACSDLRICEGGESLREYISRETRAARGKKIDDSFNLTQPNRSVQNFQAKIDKKLFIEFYGAVLLRKTKSAVFLPIYY
jgi:hypothetical protein